MSFEDDRQRQVRTGQAINLAVNLATNEAIGEDAEKVLERAQQLVPFTLAFIEATQDGAVNTVAEIQAAFPGSTVESTVTQLPTSASAPVQNPVFVRSEPGGPVAPAQQHVQQHVAQNAQPSPVPGVSDGDPDTARLWQLLLADPSAFYDNRTSKKGPNSADWAHKTEKNDKGFAKGLWIQDKFGKNPSWVAGELRNRGLA